MALVISDRVKETTTTTGTGTVTLAGAVTGFRAFSNVLSNSDTTYYAIVGSNQFEVGIGTYTSGTLTRDTVLSSSNSNLKVDFGAGSKNVFITQPADKAIYQDASGNVAGLNTDNVTEGSTNLYFTDERVDDRVGSLLVAGDNVTLSYDDAAGTLTISATEDNLSNNDTDDLAEGSTNLYYTSARANADFDTRLATKDTDDLSEGATNLYYTDARADARVNLQTGSNLDLSSKSTTDLSEGSNLYYTNERVDDRVSNLLQDGTGISFTYDDSNNVLTPTVTLSPFSTTNLSEGTNLYYTNERVDDRVANLLTAGSNITLTYDDTAGTLTIAGVEDDLSNNDTDDLSEGATNLYFTNERVDDRVSALVQNGTGISWSYNDVSGTLTPTISLSAFSTSDLSEGTNLYYTTARFDSAFSGKSTSDLSEGTNLYYTTARFDTAFSGKDTDDLSEGSTNLYYTDTRANAAIDARVTQSFVNALNVTAASVQANSVALGTDTTGNYIATIAGTANKITVTGSGSESAAVTLTLPDDVQIANDLTVAGDLTVNGATTTLGTTNLEVSDNLFELNAGLTTAPVNDSGMLIQRGTSDNAIFMWDESADKFTLGTTTSDATVTGNITITTGSLVANLEGNVTGNVTGTVSSLSNHDTGDLAEGSNLYYTDARSRAAISASGDISYDSSTGVISFTQSTAPVTSVNTLTGAVVLDTDDISEGVSNLYYTAARFNSAFAAKSTSDLSEGTNLYLTQERVEDYVGGMVSGNTETGIAVTYDDTNGKLNFVIDTLNQDTTGNAATATALETARNFSLTGDVTASAVSFDGTANVALSTSIAANTVGITELNVTDGTNGQVLTTDGAGNLSFSSAAGGYGDSDVESYLDGGTSTPTFASATVSGDFTVDTSTLKVDSTNNRVGIGTTVPQRRLTVGAGSSSEILSIYAGTASSSAIHFTDTNTTTDYQGFVTYNHVDEALRFGAAEAEGMRLTSTGLGIGVTSLARDPLHVHRASTGDCQIHMTNTSTGTSSTDGMTIFTNSAGSGIWQRENCYFRIATNNSERLRISSGGNFLYNTTGTAGSNLSDGGILLRNDSNTYMQIASGTESDTTLLYLYKKSGTGIAQTGSLASRIGDLVVGHGDVGLRFSDGGDSILPAQSGTAGDRDNAIDLGASGARFKSLYLNNFTWDSGQLRIPSSSGGDGDIYLGQYLHIYGRNKSNTAAITLNTTYDGAETDTYTPIYSGNAGAGQLIMKQSAGGEGSLKVYAKTHGTTATSAALSTFTQIAEFNDAGYFDANNGLYVNGSQVLNSSRQLTVSSTEDTIATFQNQSDNDHNFKFNLVDASDLAVMYLNGKDGGDNKFIIGYGSTHTSTPNMLALKSNTASGELGFFTNATQRMHITPTGEVGIGTDNPLIKLHVNTSGTSGLTGLANRGMIITDSIGARLVLEDTGATSNRKNFMLRSESDAFTISGLNDDGTSFTTENMFVISGSSSNVGIGTGNPLAQLELEKTNSTAIASGTSPHGIALSYGTADGNNAGLWFSPEFGADQGIAGISSQRVSGYQTDLRFYTNNTNSARSFSERLIIDQLGRHAMGNTPSISNNYILSIDSDASGQAAGIHFTHGTKNLYLGYNSTTATDNAEMWNAANGYLRFGTNNAEAVRIDSSGRWMCGVTSAIDLGQTSVEFDGTTQNGVVYRTTRSATGSTFVKFRNSSNQTIGYIYQDGSTTVNYYTNSDYRLKENVVYDWTALDRLNQLKPARYNFIGDDDVVDGFIAHELQEVMPEVVIGDKDAVKEEDGVEVPDYQGVAVSKLVPLLVKSVQELSAKVEALEAQLQGN